MRAFTKLILPELRQALEQQDRALLEAAAHELLPADFVEICDALGPELTVRLLQLLPVEQAAEVFEQLEPDLQLALLDGLGRKRIGEILDAMSPDDRADLLAELPEATREALMPLLAQAERNDVRRLLRYPEESAGGLMTTEYVALPADMTVDEALREIRRVAPDRETIYTVYVVSEDRRLEGVVSLRDILTALPGKRLADIMREHVVAVPVDADQEQVAQEFERYDFTTLPVVDDHGRLLGIITVDDVIDVLEEEFTEDMQLLGGMEPLDESYMDSSLPHLVRKRVVWLVLLLLAQTMTVLAIQRFEGLIEQIAILAAFMPLVNSSGGNTGSQSATLMCRALATGEVRFADLFRVFARELFSGAVMGVLVALVGGVVVWFSGGGLMVMAAVGLALVGVVTVGSVLGAIVPLVLHRLGVDPAVSSAPFIASLSDVIGVSTYFTIAQLVLL